MPVSFRRLRIAGFKSFAEPTNVDILPGLTGIIGPNGCGKSNIVEALRWAMGESNARQMRGDEMEDVIFAGTAGRASRNIAEVTLFLSETEGRVPPPFHEHPELEVIRKIERGNGSAYRINGQEVRARDVQTLFADIGSGARASAMVSQGRVGTLVNARPEDRRSVLEEAANITGLHARRHEAELKLKAAEANLQRAEDLKGQHQTQLNGLQKQAKQAGRYRTISQTIRSAEAELLSVQRARAERARDEAAAALDAARQAVVDAAEAAAAAAAHAAEAAAVLPPLREAESDARTTLERHRVAQEQIAAEEDRAKVALAGARRRAAQIAQDLAHAEQLQRDAAAAEDRLSAEEADLRQVDAAHPDQAQAADSDAEAAAESVRVAESEANRATEAAAEAQARAQAATQILTQAQQRAARLNSQFDNAVQERTRIAGQQVDPDAVTRAAEETAAAEAALTEARAAVEQAEKARAEAATALAAARDTQSAADSARAKLAAETQALSEVLAVKDGEKWPPVIDSLTVADGLEAALGAILGEELTSALNPDAARHWRPLPAFDPVPPLPDGAAPLADFVRGPEVLARALSQIGLVESDDSGFQKQSDLRPGQSLVSRSGAIWRWDGYTIRAGTPTQAAVRLQQRNRLNGLKVRLAGAEQAAAEARQRRTEADATAQATVAAEQAARAGRREWEQKQERARVALNALRNQAATASARLAAADDQLARVTAERDEAAAAAEQARAASAALPDISQLRAAVEQARAALSAARSRDTQARAARESLVRDHATRTNRLKAIGAERTGWAERARDSAGRVTDLRARQAEAAELLVTLESEPAAVAGRRQEALDELQTAEATYRRSAERLKAAQATQEEADKATRAAEMALGRRREDAVRAEGLHEQANHAWGVVAERILERVGVNPTLPEPPPVVDQDVEDRLRRKLERLWKEREDMGPVNLRAEQEVTELEGTIKTIETECAEITTAIAKLRGSIGHLNREGRERLNTVFQEVDRNFQHLFKRMFDGGRAHLAMVGSDDPLEAGLEIYAQPPGKKLSTLSLLSGGEQALTALSLIFAVFLCNPAPVCVLDEVDAPLDDANVDRFCALLDDMVREAGTRFLVVTHHQLTMSRMDRLYGVTMQERGVSSLLSVDLRRATEMVEGPRVAAE
ncbi:MAG TPA: AAA family ATPase [Rhodopila sp.]|uniref:chromosome segregation SMC family protein n=1 Tax=Rhodopila sp. TaxID=2480087 RepID=UPI002B58612D|nr:AAA family ATPase [Rhodopila sp.]HVY16069.1 AAA family ATPase [Rhodopila sp.]